jgi:methyl-accepting chemotaxis protein
MDWFRKLKVGTQLSLSFGALVLLMLVLASFAIARMTSISETFKAQDKLVDTKLSPLYVAREALDQTGLAARNAYIFSDEADARRELAILDEQKSIYLAALEKMTPDFGNDPAFAKVRGGLLEMAEALKRPRQLREAGQMEAYGRFLVNECSPLRRRIVADIGDMVARLQKESDQASAAADANAESAQRWIIALAGVTLLACLVLATLFTRMLLRQLGGEPVYAADIAGRIAQGDLAVEVQLKDNDQGSLLHAIKTMRDNLARIVGQVRQGTDSMASASAEIAGGNQELSDRTEHQGQALSRVATAMEELTSAVRQNTGNAQQANGLAQTASQVSEQGGRVMAQVTETMDSINASSKKITDIISVIDGIAFQTNILALNAAVEAARAGEQGRGFAVVASEVRTLAQRSATAAKEIKILIDDSVRQVGTGAELVAQAGTTMHAVVDSVKRVTGIMGEISAASVEQTRGIEDVNGALVEMDSMTQQNMALVEQATAAAQELQDQASGLAGLVGVFKLDASGAGHAAPRGQPRRIANG